MKRSNKLPVVLLATNDPDAHLLTAALEYAGFKVHQVRERAKVMPFYAKHQPDAVLIEMDFSGYDGLSIVRQIRTHNPVVPLLIILPEHNSNLIDQALEAGADDCVVYPIHPALVTKRIQSLRNAPLALLAEHRYMRHYLQEGIFLCTAEGRFVYANDPLLNLLDYPLLDLMKMTYLDVFVPAEHDMLERNIQNLKNEDALSYECNLVSKFNMLIPAEITFFRAENQSLILGIVHDLRRIRHSEMSWRNSEERYRNFFDAVNDAILIVDMDTGRFLDVNANALKWLGYTRPELLSLRLIELQTDLEYAPAASGETHESETALAVSGRVIFQTGLRKKNGEILPVELSSRIVDFEGRQAVINLARDITERIEVEQQERQQRRLAEALRDTASILNHSLDRNEVLEKILISAEKVVDADSINVMVIENGQAVAIGRHNLKPNLPDHDKRTLTLDIETTATLRWIIENRKPLIIDDVRQYDGWVVRETENWMRSFVGVPILQDGVVAGFISLDGTRVGQFTEEQAAYLQVFADQAAIALRNASLHESLKERASELEKRVSERTAELQNERNLLQTILDNLPDEIYVKDLAGRFLMVNKPMMKRIKQRFGLDSILGMTDADMVSTPRAQGWRDDELRIISTGKPALNHEVISIDNDGRKFSLLSTKAPILDETGKVTGIVGINHDISELRNTEASLNHIITSVNCLLWESDASYENRTYHWGMNVTNETAAMRFFPLQINEGESYSEAFIRSIPREDFVRIDQTTKAAMRNNYSSFYDEFRFRNADGELRWLRHDVRMTQLSEGRWTLVGVCIDISEQKWTMETLMAVQTQLEQRVEERTQALLKANEELKQEIYNRSRIESAQRESEARYRALVDHAPEAIVVFDLETDHFVDVNQNAVKLFGYPRETLMTKRYIDMSPDYQPDKSPSKAVMRRKIQKAVKGGDNPPFEWTYQSADDRQIPCEVRLLLLPTTDSTLIRGSIIDITARKEAEAALLASEQKYRSLTNQLPIGVYRSSGDGILLYANDAAAKLVDFESGKSMEGESVLQFYDSPQDRANLITSYHSDVAEGSQIDEYELTTKLGRRIRVRDTWHIIYDENGEIDYIDGTLIDITEQTHMQQQEHEQRIFAEALTSAASDLNRSLELDSVIDRILKHIQRVLPPFEGVSIMLLEGEVDVHVIRYQQVTDGMMEDKVPLYTPLDINNIPNLRLMRDTAEPVVISDTNDSDKWIKRDDISNWIRSYVAAPIISEEKVIGFLNVSSGTPSLFTAEHGNRLLAFATQVGIAIQNARLYATVQNHAQDLGLRVEEATAEIRKQSSQLNAILDGMSEGVVYYDAYRNPIYTNRSLSLLTGYSERELRETPVLEDSILYGEEGSYRTFYSETDRALLERGTWQGIVRMHSQNGREFDSSWTLNLIRDAKGEPIGSVAVIRDISKERQLERQRSSFIAQASHELRTPLANIKTRLYLIRRQPEKREEHLSILEAVTQRMNYLIEDLLDISKSEHGMMNMRSEIVKIQDIVREVVHLQRPMAQEKRIAILENLPDTPIYVSVDVHRTERMFINLLANAINYTHEGGLVKFEIEQRENRVGVLVHDNGAGIPAEVMPHVFKPFVRGTSEKTGSGLGLSIVKEIVESHGGTIEVESEVGVGTTFCVWLNTVVREKE